MNMVGHDDARATFIADLMKTFKGFVNGFRKLFVMQNTASHSLIKPVFDAFEKYST